MYDHLHIMMTKKDCSSGRSFPLLIALLLLLLSTVNPVAALRNVKNRSLFQSTVEQENCADDAEFTFALDNDGGIARCLDVAENPVYITNYCDRTHIKYACPATCLESQGLACVCPQDNAQYLFPLRRDKNELRDCEWITQNPDPKVTESRQSKYCYQTDEESASDVGENCVVSCQFCKGTFRLFSNSPSTSPSTIPTLSPSGNPSECVDEPSWMTSENGLTCSQIEQLSVIESLDTPLQGYNYCDKLSTIIWNGKLISEACCICGGSVFKNVVPSVMPSVSPSPTLYPSESPTECIDEPGWQIHAGVTCEDIKLHNSFLSGYDWCDIFGQTFWNGKSVHEACCTCGGSDFETMIPSSSPTFFNWREIPYESYLPNPSSDVGSISLSDDDTLLIDIGFTYNWFGTPIDQLRISSNGQLNMNSTDNESNCCAAYPIGNYSQPRIAFVQEDIDPFAGGEIYVSYSSVPLSFKISFDNVPFHSDDDTYTQASVELLPNGDIIICYGMGTLGYFDSFAAGIEDPMEGAYPLPFEPFDATTGITDVWPTYKCWKFLMPYSLPSAIPSVTSSPSISPAPSQVTGPWTLWKKLGKYKPLSPDEFENVTILPIGDISTANLTLGFSYNWFGQAITEVKVSSNGQLNMDMNADYEYRFSPVSIGSFEKARIAFVQTDLYPPAGGYVKIGTKNEPKSIKISFERINFYDPEKPLEAQVELFENGDIIFCYGSLGSAPFAAGVEEPSFQGAFPIPDENYFDISRGIAFDWPKDHCYKFSMAVALPSDSPSTKPSLSSSPSISSIPTTAPSLSSSPTVSAAPTNPERFTITLINTGSNMMFNAAFESAKARWESIIIGDLEDRDSVDFDWFNGTLSDSYSGPVDDVVIGFEMVYIDGAGGILGMAGPTFIRSSTDSPIAGIMQFDEDDFASLSQVDAEIIILHEMGHVLGLVGVIGACSTCPINFNYPCSLAQQEYQAINPGTTLKLENNGGVGTICFHWEDDNFPSTNGLSELMTGFFEGGVGQAISRVSIAALDESFPDYEVDYSQADPYFLNSDVVQDEMPHSWKILRPTESFVVEGRINHDIVPIQI